MTPTQPKEIREIVLKGISGAPGICIGQAYIVDREGVNVIEKYYIQKDRLPDEINRFKAAVKKAKDELTAIIEDTPEELRQHIGILETHLALSKDKMLYGRTIDTIKNEMVNAEWGLKKVAAEIKAMFQNISDPYLKGRASDITHVSERILRNLLGAGHVSLSNIDKRVILVAHDLSPADVSQIKRDRIKGFITDLGGKASHTGIIARTMGIPCVLGLESATASIKGEDLIVVDGKAGVVIINPTKETITRYEERIRRYEEYNAAIIRESQGPAKSADGLRLPVLANIELHEEVKAVQHYGGDGVGLFRTEFIYLSKRAFPSEDELYEEYRKVLSDMAPNPVTLRTLDINGDKALSKLDGAEEANPALGLRAIRFCLDRPEIFKTQLRAILRASAHGNARIMFPMISSCEEVYAAKRILAEASASLEREKIDFDREIAVGIMIEVPSAVIMADALADAVDFFSIGTNDLIQYALAIDRGNRQVAHLYHPLNPAVLRMIHHVVMVGRAKGIRVMMCGEMAADPFNIPFLLGIGVDEFSMSPQSIPAVKEMIHKLSAEDAQQFVQDVLKQATVKDVLDLLQEAYGDILPVQTNNGA